MGTQTLRGPLSLPHPLPCLSLSSNLQERNCLRSNSASAAATHMTLGRLVLLSRPWFLTCRVAVTIAPALQVTCQDECGALSRQLREDGRVAVWSWDVSTARWTCRMGRELRRQAGSRWRERQDFCKVFSLHSWVTFLKKSNQEATPGDSLLFSFLVHFCNFVSGTDFHQTLFFF